MILVCLALHQICFVDVMFQAIDPGHANEVFL